MLTSLGDANDIPLLVDSRDGVALNGSWPSVKAKFEVLEQNRVNPSFLELSPVSSRMEMEM